MFKNLDNYREYYNPINMEFVCLTIEIWYANSCYCIKEDRLLQEKEYVLNNYGKMLQFLFERDYVNRYDKKALEKLKEESVGKKVAIKSN